MKRGFIIFASLICFVLLLTHNCMSTSQYISFASTSIYRGARENAYFSIHYDNQCIMIDDKTLSFHWYHAASHKKFTQQQNLYERADNITSFDKSKTQIQKQFPEIFMIVRKLEKQINTPAYEGHTSFDPSRDPKFRITGARDGRELDTEQLCVQILKSLKSKTYTDIIAPIKSRPHKSEEETLSNICLRGSFSSYFDSGNLQRANNIRLALECFNGKVVQNGETVSFNKTVGARSSERGYKEANIIIDGEFVKGVGGGVCQVSTTVFNAAIAAGLSIVESHNHSLAVGYVPVGRDAMISSAVDLVFKNNSGSPIYIEANAPSGSRAVVKIYGANLRNLQYKIKTNTVELPIEEEVRGAKPENTASFVKRTIEAGEPALDVHTYIEVYKGEKLVNSKLIRRSRYKGKTRVVEYIRKEPPSPCQEILTLYNYTNFTPQACP